jgi:FAD binding domain-containing protein/D-arabinono-1,4-lactone oxidase
MGASRHPRMRNPQVMSRPPWPNVRVAAIPEGGAVVVCASTTYTGGDKPAQTWTNWSGHFSGTVSRSVEPDSLSSLVNIVKQATSTGHQLHVIGSGWAFENIAWSPDWMVSLARLNKPVTYVTNSALRAPWAVSGGGNNLVFHIEAGATIADLNDALTSAGLAMPTLGGNVGQAVAGAISTGTHGGDPTQPPLADAVVAMHVVTEGGRELWVERASEPVTDDLKLANALPCKDTEIIRDDGVFNAMLVAAGRFGVIYSYVLRVRPKFRLAEWTMELPRVVFTTALRDGISRGTFLQPLLTMLPNPPAALGADTTNLVGLQVVFDTQNLASCFVTRRWPTTQTPDLNTTAGTNVLCSLNTAGVWAAASLVLSPMVAIPFYGAVVGAEMAKLQADLAAHPGWSPGDMLADVMTSFWRLGRGDMIRTLSCYSFNDSFKASMVQGKRGPSADVLSASRAESKQTCVRADSIEPIFDAHAPGYIDYLDVILNAAPGYRQSGYISVRWSAKSKALISMHNFGSGHGVAIEVTSLRGLPDNAQWFTLLETEAVSRGGRPHWGQINTLNGAQVAGLFGQEHQNWRVWLKSIVGSSATFSNPFSAQRELEPATNAVAATTGKTAAQVIADAAALPTFELPKPTTPLIRRPPGM